MDRQIVYTGQIPLDTDILRGEKNAMLALGKFAGALFGSSTAVAGLACGPTSPASMSVQVAPGEIYALKNVDDTPYGSLDADTTHTVVKQGMMLDPSILSCTAPVTVGNSIAYLLQAQYQETDDNSTVLPYYNASDPSSAFSGPGNNGVSQNTTRAGACAVQIKAGIAAPTGTQTAPAPDAGWTALWVITVAYGQTTITSSNIVKAAGAPFIIPYFLFAPLDSPVFVNTPQAPTPPPEDNSQRLATTAFVAAAIAGVGTPDLSDYYTKEQADSRYLQASALADYYTKEQSDARFANLDGAAFTGAVNIAAALTLSGAAATQPLKFLDGTNNTYSVMDQNAEVQRFYSSYRGGAGTVNMTIAAQNGNVTVTRGGLTVAGQTVSTGGFKSSDIRLKKNVKSRAPRDLADQIEFREWDWIVTGTHDLGPIAQHMQQIAPEYVIKDPRGFLAIDTAGIALECALGTAARLRKLEVQLISTRSTR